VWRQLNLAILKKTGRDGQDSCHARMYDSAIKCTGRLKLICGTEQRPHHDPKASRTNSTLHQDILTTLRFCSSFRMKLHTHDTRSTIVAPHTRKAGGPTINCYVGYVHPHPNDETLQSPTRLLLRSSSDHGVEILRWCSRTILFF